MKKGLALLLALAMLLSLAACSAGGGNKEKNDAPEEEQAPPVTQPEEPGPVQSEEPSMGEEPLLPDPERDEEEEPVEDLGEWVVRVSHEDVTLFYAGETFRLTAWDSRGNDPDVCTYTSADPAVATVDEAGGQVTAVAPGTTTVTAHVEFGEEKRDLKCIVRCRWEDAESEEPALPVSGTAAELPALNEFFATLQGSYDGLGAMMVLEGELLENYYPGLSNIAAVEEVLVQETMISVANVAVGLVKLSDDATAEDVNAVRDILQARITAQAEGGAWYPASCETWGQGVITSEANRVGMFVYPDGAQEMADLFHETFGN